MKTHPKLKSFVIIAVFILVMALPICYALIRERMLSHTEAKKDIPHEGNTMK